MKNIKENLTFIVILILVIVILWMRWENRLAQKKLMEQVNSANKEIIKLDKLKKEGNGQYAKLVNYFSSQKELSNQLSQDNKELSKLLKKQEERLLMINKSIISLEGAVVSGGVTVDPMDTSIINLALTYPNSEEAFINWNGKIFSRTRSYVGEWSFGKLPLQIILTETNRGLWNTRLVGPSWLKVDSMQINSLPPEEIVQVEYQKIGLLLGGGYFKSFSQTQSDAFSITGGAYIKNHNLLVNLTSVGQVGVNYVYRFNTKKK
jgi:uncharacterized membrane-anchored protein YhcB (DUF1043 family)